MSNHKDVRMQKTDPKTGHSAQTMKLGRAKKWKPTPPFFAYTLELMTSPAFHGLRIPARKIFDFIVIEHMRQGGAENGNLAAPYRQLVEFGISERDISKSINMLIAFGLIRRTDIKDESQFTAGRRAMARYRLTMIPDKWGNLPSDEWTKISLADVLAFEEEEKRQSELKKKRKLGVKF